MTKIPPSDAHSAFVQTWENNTNTGLSKVNRARLFEQAIHAVEKRSCLTLSNITLLVILDRVLHNCTDIYPMLSEVSLDAHSLNFQKLQNLDDHELDDFIEALRYLLIELLRVLARITADILTIPLHNELLKVTWNEPEKK